MFSSYFSVSWIHSNVSIRSNTSQTQSLTHTHTNGWTGLYYIRFAWIIVFLLMRRSFILINLNWEWYRCSIEYNIYWNMTLQHKTHQNSASVFVRFTLFMLFFWFSFSRLFVVHNLFFFSSALPLPVCRCCSRCSVLLGWWVASL